MRRCEFGRKNSSRASSQQQAARSWSNGVVEYWSNVEIKMQDSVSLRLFSTLQYSSTPTLHGQKNWHCLPKEVKFEWYFPAK